MPQAGIVKPNWLRVEYAITLFKSCCDSPVVAARNEVIAPEKVVTIKARVEYSENAGLLAIMNTPAVAVVAAWVSADTGVGPSMASGNHVCDPICADLPTAPGRRYIRIAVMAGYPSAMGEEWPFLATYALAQERIVGKSPVKEVVEQPVIPRANPVSPILFTGIALIAAPFARWRVYRGFINECGAGPAPSRPAGECEWLSPATGIGIGNVGMGE